MPAFWRHGIVGGPGVFTVMSLHFMSIAMNLRLLTAAAVLLLATACASTPPAPATATDGVLVGANGMTLYTFDKDAAGSGKSVCNGPCAANWPPLMAAADAKASGDWS